MASDSPCNSNEEVKPDNYTSQECPSTLSKNQQKRKRKMEMKLKHRAEKRKLERERRKEKHKQAKLDGVVMAPSRKQLKHTQKAPVDVTVVIDSSFETHMQDNDLKKLLKQIQHCYAINRRSEQPFKINITSYGGKVRELVEGLNGTSSWEVTWSEKSYDKIFTKEQLIYLSSESANLLESVETGKVYVIGGLVDHNSKKGLCHELAVQKGITHAQLPISEYVEMKSRKVLTIDHVFEILQQQYREKNWETAFFNVIPKRKGAQTKTDSSSIDST